MGWLIGAAVVLGGVLLLTQVGRRGFSYRGRRYRRNGDGSFTYVDGSPIDDPKERAEVEAHWNDSQSDSSGSNGGDGGGDGGGGGGD
jgi:uncharacterized membrane protein YgcG